MPKKKSKSKQKLSSGTQPEEAGLHYVALSFVTEEMEEMQAHPISGHCVEKIFEFPDCWSKKGLKECHKHIGIISEHAKKEFDNASSLKAKASIVGLWGRLSCDAVLCDKLMTPDTLDRIISMYDHKEGLLVTLQALATITRHCAKARSIIAAALTPRLVGTLKAHTRDQKLVCLTLIIIMRTVPQICEQFPELNTILPAIHSVMCDDNPIRVAFDPAKQSILAAAYHHFPALEKHQPSLDFIVACFRLRNLAARAASLGSLLTFYGGSTKGEEEGEVDIMKRGAALRNLPLHLQEAIDSYGALKCEESARIRSLEDYEQANEEAIMTGDFCRLGIRLVDLIYRSQHAIIEGWHELDEAPDVPYDTYVDALPIVAQALLDEDPIKYADAADVLQIKFYLLRQQHKRARTMALAAMQRSSQEQYWYYACASSEKGSDQILRWAKRGLACPTKADYVRYNLLSLASHAACSIGIRNLATAGMTGSQRSILPVALLHSAREDALKFVTEAPPDSRDLEELLVILMFMEMVLRGYELSPDLREFQEYRRSLKQVDEFNLHLQRTSGVGQWRRAYETIIERFERAANFWDERLRDINNDIMENRQAVGNEYAPIEQLQDLFSAVKLDDIKDPNGSIRHDYGNEGKIHSFASYMDSHIRVDLYQCFYCGHCSVSLKACSRCGVARYCDASCQKKGWENHKEACRPKSK